MFTSLSADLAVYVPMDELASTEPSALTPATGAIASCAGATVVPGVHGNGLEVTNPNTTSGNRISLGYLCDRCADRWSLCSRGWTLSFWFFLPPPSSRYTRMVHTAGMLIYIDDTGDRMIIGMNIYMESSVVYGFMFPQLDVYNVWYQYTATFDGNESFNFYINGCKVNLTRSQNNQVTTGYKYFEMACSYGGSCGSWSFDELYIWESIKPDWFIWKLYTMYN